MVGMKKSPARSLLRPPLITPLFIILALCVWSASVFVPFHLCASHAFYCTWRGPLSWIAAAQGYGPHSGRKVLIVPFNMASSQARVEDNGGDGMTTEYADDGDDDMGTGAMPNVVLEETVAYIEAGRMMSEFREQARLNDKEDANECEGRKIFIYNLPPKFNIDLLSQCDRMLPWYSMCTFFLNSGMGTIIPSAANVNAQVLTPHGCWFHTHQYSLEVLFHARLREHACVTYDPAEAALFYVPYYAGLDVLRWHFLDDASNVERDRLGEELVTWVSEQPWFRRHGGQDHVLVLGKISWDFRRYIDAGGWGSRLLELQQVQNMTRLLIERHPWQTNDIGVPHPTFFHPRTDSDIHTWQAMVHNRRRPYLASFAGSPRPNMTQSIRSLLIENCLNHTHFCHFRTCDGEVCLHPQSMVQLFLDSQFCLQPPGDSATRRSVFDALIAGCIPVFFDPCTAYFQYPWHLPSNNNLYSIYIALDDVRKGLVDVVQTLRRIPRSVRQAMHRRIVYEIMPGLVYAQPGHKLKEFRDAFDISLQSLFRRREYNLRSQGSSSYSQ